MTTYNDMFTSIQQRQPQPIKSYPGLGNVNRCNNSGTSSPSNSFNVISNRSNFRCASPPKKKTSYQFESVLSNFLFANKFTAINGFTITSASKKNQIQFLKCYYSFYNAM